METKKKLKEKFIVEINNVAPAVRENKESDELFKNDSSFFTQYILMHVTFIFKIE